MFLDPATDTAPPAHPGADDDWTIPQHWERFTPAEHAVWDHLLERQCKQLAGRAVSAFSKGVDLLRLSQPGIPHFDALNERLYPRTGWTVVAVPGLVPDDVFFRHLSQRRFPAGNFIRPATQLDYLEEPDIFHDIFGHVPMLAQPGMADFMQVLGKLGLVALAAGAIHHLSRLYWYTVEFGLAREDGELRIFGAGLASSFGEARFALESRLPRRTAFDLPTVLRTRYRSDRFQDGYFIIESFERLLSDLQAADLPNLYREIADCPDLDPDTGHPCP